MLSPPPGLSQSATSFIASCRQGIHQTPLSRLIRSGGRRALLHGDLRPQPAFHLAPVSEVFDPDAPLGRGSRPGWDRRNSSRSRKPIPRSVSSDLERLSPSHPEGCTTRPPLGARPKTSRVLLSERCHARLAARDFCLVSRPDGKMHPRDAPGDRVVGGACRDRTGDLMLAKHALSRLS